MDFALPALDVWDHESRFSGRSVLTWSEPRNAIKQTVAISEAVASARAAKTRVIGSGDTGNPTATKISPRTTVQSSLIEARPVPVSATFQDAASEIEKIAAQRIKILAASYVVGEGQKSEVLARLEILNRRLTQRLPRVSVEQVAALEETVNEMAALAGEGEDFDRFMNSL